MSTAGKWKIEIASPYPAWCKIFYDGEEIAHGVHHKDLRDLEYVIKRAILKARDELPEPYKREMD